jgi:hypothetical protein
VKARHSVIVCGALLTGDRHSEPPRAAVRAASCDGQRCWPTCWLKRVAVFAQRAQLLVSGSVPW